MIFVCILAVPKSTSLLNLSYVSEISKKLNGIEKMTRVKKNFQALHRKVKPTLILVNSVLYVSKKVFLLM